MVWPFRCVLACCLEAPSSQGLWWPPELGPRGPQDTCRSLLSFSEDWPQLYRHPKDRGQWPGRLPNFERSTGQTLNVLRLEESVIVLLVFLLSHPMGCSAVCKAKALPAVLFPENRGGVSNIEEKAGFSSFGRDANCSALHIFSSVGMALGPSDSAL